MAISRDQIVTFLATVPLFHQCTTEELNALADAIQSCTHEIGQEVWQHEPERQGLLICVQGEHQVLLHQQYVDVDAELTRLYPGDYFGDLALVSGQSTRAKIRAVVPSMILSLVKEHFDSLFTAKPDFARRICQSLARYVHQTYDRLGSVPFVQLDHFPNMMSTIGLLPPKVCLACRCVVVDRQGMEVKVAMVDPTNADARRFISSALRSYEVQWLAIQESDFEAFATRYLSDGHGRSVPSQPFERLVCIDAAGSVISLSGSSESELLARFISQAIRSGASDIHIEPGMPSAGMRLRIDGRMTSELASITPAESRQLVSQIKVLAELDITRTYVPQDGSFSLQADSARFDIRVSTIPCLGGEKAVLRVITPNPQFERLDNLIVDPALSRLVFDIFDSPSGLVLVTGPTGSGKTTTLYAGLNSIWRNDQEINVVTIEDPIEYNLPFATQVQVNREVGLTFATFVRAVLRQDPDVILVGEIRDAESAAIALEAATTGHLVLSSLHTHSAFETIARLRQLQVRPYLLADALRGVISQQLLPRMRPGVATPVDRGDDTYARLQRLGILPPNYDGTIYRPSVSRNGSPDDFTEDPESGRIAAFEVLAMTDQLRDLIERETPLSVLRANADKRLFRPMAESARSLLERRLVTPERVERLFSRVEARTSEVLLQLALDTA